MQRIIDVKIGEVKVARNGEILKAILGSCVGIGIIWKSRGICALAHALLPVSPTASFTIDGRYVDHAIRSLLVLMEIKPENKAEVEVVIVGGGNMMTSDSNDNSSSIGVTNIKSARQESERHGLRILRIDEGKDEGRKITIDAAICSFRIERIERITVAS